MDERAGRDRLFRREAFQVRPEDDEEGLDAVEDQVDDDTREEAARALGASPARAVG